MHNPNHKERFNQIFKQKNSESARKSHYSDASILLVAGALGFFSSWFAFKKTAENGASLVRLPWPVSQEDKETNSFIGGFVLNAILNAYFANDCIQSFKSQSEKKDKKIEAFVILTTTISTIPFVATTLINHDPIYSAAIEIAAYFFIHYQGASFLVNSAVDTFKHIRTAQCKKNKQSPPLYYRKRPYS